MFTNVKLVLGIITYFKGGSDELLLMECNKMIPSIKTALDYCSNPQDINVVIYVNDKLSQHHKVELKEYLNIYSIPYVIIGGKKSSTPLARNELIEYCIMQYPNTNLWMLDDDDEIFKYSLQSILKYLEVTDDRYHPTLLSMNYVNGRTKPNNERGFNDPASDAYEEMGGMINCNMIFNTDYFLNNNLGFPDFMKSGVKSHDTIFDVKNSIIMAENKWNFLVNPTYNYKLLENSISTSVPRPDNVMYHTLSYFYNYQKTKVVKNFYYYNPYTDRCQIISPHIYRHLRFDLKDMNLTKDRIGDRKLLVMVGGKLTTDLKFYSCEIKEGLTTVLFTNGARFRLSYYGELENLSKYGCSHYLQFLNIPKEDYSKYFFMRIHSLYNLE